MSEKPRTYKDAGVDLEKGEESTRRIKKLVKTTFSEDVLTDVGLFGGLFNFDKSKYRSPVLVSSADGVGTKLKLAFMTGVHNTIGQCLVNHCVNDILSQGARPLFFLDYFATGKLEPETVEQVIEGLSTACRENGCALIGGETAEMPDFYDGEEYDLAGFVVGVVERDKIIDGTQVREGDILLSLPSSGLHTNGYTLARDIAFKHLGHKASDYIDELGKTIGEALLEVHLSYLDPVSALLDRDCLSGLAHITGGGLEGNVSRIVPDSLSAEIDVTVWEPLPIFRYLQKGGNVDLAEMYRVFNMSAGMILFVPEEKTAEAEEILKNKDQPYYTVGRVRKGDKKVILKGLKA